MNPRDQEFRIVRRQDDRGAAQEQVFEGQPQKRYQHAEPASDSKSQNFNFAETLRRRKKGGR